MTKQPKPAPEIEVSKTMVAAGVAELLEHRLGDDLGYLAEQVYRAMRYEAGEPRQ